MDRERVDFPRAKPRRWWVLAAAAVGMFMVSLDMNIIGVALPSMAADLQAAGGIVWVVLGYTLAMAAFVTVAGRMVDVWGRKRVLLTGMALFVTASVGCAGAESLSSMIVMRVLQGIGGAGIVASVGVIATVLFPEGERGRAMGVIGMIGPLGGLMGPGLGGWLSEGWGWNLVFWINVPVGAAAMLCLWRLLPPDPGRQPASFDWMGTGLAAGGAFFLLLGLSGDGLSPGWRFALLAAGAALFAALPVAERKAAQPVLPPVLLQSRSFSLPLSAVFTSAAAISGLGFVNVFYLQQELGLTPSAAGVVLLCFPLAMTVAAQAGGWITDRLGANVSARLGAAVSAGGMLVYAALAPAAETGLAAALLFLIGLGHGLFASPSYVALMAAAPPEHMGVASGVANLARNVGFALGPALAAFLWQPGEADAMRAMQSALFVMSGVQVLTLLAAFGFAPTAVRGKAGGQRR